MVEELLMTGIEDCLMYMRLNISVNLSFQKKSIDLETRTLLNILFLNNSLKNRKIIKFNQNITLEKLRNSLQQKNQKYLVNISMPKFRRKLQILMF